MHWKLLEGFQILVGYFKAKHGRWTVSQFTFKSLLDTSVPMTALLELREPSFKSLLDTSCLEDLPKPRVVSAFKSLLDTSRDDYKLENIVVSIFQILVGYFVYLADGMQELQLPFKSLLDTSLGPTITGNCPQLSFKSLLDTSNFLGLFYMVLGLLSNPCWILRVNKMGIVRKKAQLSNPCWILPVNPSGVAFNYIPFKSLLDTSLILYFVLFF